LRYDLGDPVRPAPPQAIVVGKFMSEKVYGRAVSAEEFDRGGGGIVAISTRLEGFVKVVSVMPRGLKDK
jgi:hypothetical protein